MSLIEWFNTFENKVRPRGEISIEWSMKGRGFGELYFYVDLNDGTLYCDNECLSKERIKELLCMMVDQCKLTDDMSLEEKDELTCRMRVERLLRPQSR